MKDLKTLALTLGIGTALAFVITSSSARKNIVKTSRKIKNVVRNESKSWEDDNDMRYI